MATQRAILLLVAAFAVAAAAPAFSFGIGQLGAHFGQLGSEGGGIPPAAQPTGKILQVDGVSHILQVDGVSKICRAGGC